MIQLEICPWCSKEIKVSLGNRNCPQCDKPITVTSDDSYSLSRSFGIAAGAFVLKLIGRVN